MRINSLPFFEKRNKAKHVHHYSCCKHSEIVYKILQKETNATNVWIAFLNSTVSFQMGMHESQHCPQEMENEAFVNAVCPELIGTNHHPEFILNMD